MSRDELVLGPDGLTHKTAIALHHGGISLISYSARDSPKPVISQTPWYIPVYTKKNLRSKVVLLNLMPGESSGLPTAFSSPQ